MFRRAFLLLAMTVAPLFALAGWQHSSVSSPRALDPGDSFRLTLAERRQAEARARTGDTHAAKRLADEALYSDNDAFRAMKWLRIAAAYGDATAKKSLEVLRRASE
jgi:hypothetical protein